MLHAWTLEYQHMMLCVWWWKHTKTESQWPAREGRRVALATSGSTRFRRMPTPYRYTLWRSEITRDHGAAQRSTRTTRRRWWLLRLQRTLFDSWCQSSCYVILRQLINADGFTSQQRGGASMGCSTTPDLISAYHLSVPMNLLLSSSVTTTLVSWVLIACLSTVKTSLFLQCAIFFLAGEVAAFGGPEGFVRAWEHNIPRRFLWLEPNRQCW